MSINLQTIKRDYESLMKIINDITTVEQLKSLNNKDMFGYINVDNKSYYSVHDYDYDNDGKYMINPHYCTGHENINHIDNHILYGEYGCLGTICVCIDNGKISDIFFDIWDDENDYMIAEQVNIDEVDEDSFEFWMEDMKEFFNWCKYNTEN